MIKKIMIKYDELTTLSEVDNYVNSIIKSSSDHNQMITKTEFISDGIVLTLKQKLHLVKK